MLYQFQQFLKRRNLLNPSLQFALAVSGGIDSAALCELAKQSGLNFTIAHCNFKLRGAESERDEEFVRSLGKKYEVPVLIQSFETAAYATIHKLSIQEAARNLRYHWFGELHKEKGYDFTLLAHHANDNMETVLMHFFRGSGLHGLTGMPDMVKDSYCLRPLLQLTRYDIETFAKQYGLSWVEDSSNSSDKYTRNFFRNTVIPEIKKIYPQAEENVLATIERLKKTEALYDKLVNNLEYKLIEKTGNEFKIAVNQLNKYSATSLPYEIFKRFHFTEKQVYEIMKLSESETGRYIENENFRVIKNRAWLIISPKHWPFADTLVIEETTKKIYLPDGYLEMKKEAADKVSINKSMNVALLDCKEFSFPLLLRRWKAGDYFYPLGMRKKKKLSRFFIDQKLTTTQKENTWVLEANKKILWIVGYRIDDRFKITPGTKEVLQITLIKS